MCEPKESERPLHLAEEVSFPGFRMPAIRFYHGRAREHRSAKSVGEAVFRCCAGAGHVKSEPPAPALGGDQSGLAHENSEVGASA